jgi:hypothetical protein
MQDWLPPTSSRRQLSMHSRRAVATSPGSHDAVDPKLTFAEAGREVVEKGEKRAYNLARPNRLRNRADIRAGLSGHLFDPAFYSRLDPRGAKSSDLYLAFDKAGKSAGLRARLPARR